MRPLLDTSYGATSLDEFVAEARSNLEFRAKLGAISPDGKRISALTRLKYIFINMYRRLRGLDSKKPGSALDKVDKLVDYLASPAPDARLADDLFFSSTVEKSEEAVVNSLGKFGAGPVSDADRQIFSDYVPGMKGTVRRAFLRALPLNSIGDYAQPTLPDMHPVIIKLFKTVQRQAGKKRQWHSKTKALHKELNKAFKGKPEEKKLYNDSINFQTRYRVDMTKPRSFYEGFYFTWLDGDKLGVSKQRFNNGKDRNEAIKNFKKANPNVKNIRRINEDPTKLEAYDWILKNKWKPLLKKMPQAKDLYLKHRGAYETAYTDFINTLLARIAKIDANPALKQKYKDKILFDLLNKNQVEPYFPLYRRGDKWLMYQGVDPISGGVEVYKELFESDAARQKKIRELRNDTQLQQQLSNLGQTLEIQSYNKVLSADQLPGVNSAFAFHLLGKIKKDVADSGEAASKRAIKAAKKKGATDAEAQDAGDKARNNATKGASRLEGIVFDAIVQASPERSLIKAFTPRQDIAGFQEDQIEVLRQKLPSFTDQVVKLEFDTELDAIQNELQKATEKYYNTPKEDFATDVQSIVQEYIEFNRNPYIAPWSRVLKSLGFWWTLGLNVSSALVNLFVVPMVVFPYLGGKYGYFNTMSALYRNTKLYFKTGMNRQVKDFEGLTGRKEFDGPSLTNLNYEDFDSLPDEFKEKRFDVLANMLDDRGLAAQTTVADMLDLEGTDTPTLTRVNSYMGFAFHQGERMTRHVTAMTAYELEVQKRIKDKGGALTEEEYAEAAENAILETEHTNSGAILETAPRLSQSNIGSVLMLYKRFAISMIYLQMKMFRQVFSSRLSQAKTAEERAQIQAENRIAKKQLAGLFATSGLMAGIQGMPIIGVIRSLWNMFFKTMGDEDDDDFDTWATGYFKEGPYNGLLHSMGLDIGPRIGMSNLLYRSLPNQEQTSIVLDMLEMGGGPVAGVGIRMADQGIPLMFKEGEVVRGMEKMLPSAFGNILRASRFATEGATTMRGDPIIEDISAGAILSQAMGFAPSEYTRQIEINARNKYQDNKIIDAKTKLLQRRNRALVEYDDDEVDRVEREIEEFNERHPEVAITSDTKDRSWNSYQRTTREMLNGVYITPARRRRVEEEIELLWGI